MVLASASIVAAAIADVPPTNAHQLLNVVPRDVSEACFQLKSKFTESYEYKMQIENLQSNTTSTYELPFDEFYHVVCVPRNLKDDAQFRIRVDSDKVIEQEEFTPFYMGARTAMTQEGLIQFYSPKPGVACVHATNPNTDGLTRFIIRSHHEGQVGYLVAEAEVHAPKGMSTHCENYPIVQGKRQVVRLSASVGKAWAQNEIYTDDRTFVFVPFMNQQAEAEERM